MKYFIVFVILFAAFLLWRGNRQGAVPKARARAAPPRLEDMVSCAVCSLHVPQAEATPGLKGMYCCAEHRERAEG